MRPTQTASTVALLALAACRDDTRPPPDLESRFGELVVVTGAPILPSEPPVTPIEVVLPESLTAIGASGTSLLLGTTTTTFELLGETLSELEVWSDDPSAPTRTGRVDLIARDGATLVVLAEEGLFFDFNEKLVPSPASEAIVALTPQAMHASGDALYLCTGDGLAKLQDEKLSWLSIADEAGAPTAVYESSQGLLYVAYGETLYEIDGDEAFAVPYDTGVVHAIAPGLADAVVFATDHGLFRRDAKGAWTQHTLTDDQAAAASLDLAFYPKDGTYARTAEGVLLLREGELSGVVTSDAERLISDDFGRLWLGAGRALEGLPIGTPVGFAEDVAPLLASHCATCHATGEENAPIVSFESYDDVALLGSVLLDRVASGQMPPAGSPALSGDAVDLINRW
ncbi:MAG: hypothetical protein KC731_38610, partial [Myxococcales bacterium]|nr:hypothetical protein [Myxococcales bacterium]